MAEASAAAAVGAAVVVGAALVVGAVAVAVVGAVAGAEAEIEALSLEVCIHLQIVRVGVADAPEEAIVRSAKKEDAS